jgi:hypothetical protein
MTTAAKSFLLPEEDPELQVAHGCGLRRRRAWSARPMVDE